MKLKPCASPAKIFILFLTLFLLSALSESIASEADDTSRCSGITLEKAAEILKIPLADLHKSSSDLMVSPDDLEKKTYKTPPYRCSIRSKTNFLKLITYVVYQYTDPGQARVEFDKMQKGFETVSKVDAVPDIGDAAFWAGDSRFQRMAAIKGGVVIDVLSPKEAALQKQILLMVLNRF